MCTSRPDRFLRRHDMLSMVGVPQSTVYLMMQRGEFPRSYQISRRLVGWKESEIAGLDGEPSRLSAPVTSTGGSNELPDTTGPLGGARRVAPSRYQGRPLDRDATSQTVPHGLST